MGGVDPTPGLPKLATSSPAPSGPPLPRPPPGAQTWALGLAGALSMVVLRPSDLQVPFFITLGEPGAPSAQGHTWSPSPTWIPAPAQELPRPPAGRLQSTPSCPDEVKPVLTPGGPCPVALPPFEPSSLLACGTSGSPPLWRRTFYLLRVGTTWCMEERAHPQPTPPLTARTLGWGCILGWRLL